ESCAKDQRSGGTRSPSQGCARLEAARIRMDERIVGFSSDRRRCGSKARVNIQIYEAAIDFGNRGFVFPTHAKVQRHRRSNMPVGGEIGVREALPEVSVRVSESNGTRRWNADQEILEIDSGCRTCKRKGSASVLLRQ